MVAMVVEVAVMAYVFPILEEAMAEGKEEEEGAPVIW